ncbi:hypothetical protein MJO29_015803 [Puccinia striiformis f. sp. tritici]|nr:hypothetical protein MJO29_015803 [Puccinia striiformis f. sp. tritici]
MYRCFFVAVVLILQTMASAAPSSSSEAGAHVRRIGRCEVNLPSRHENDGSTGRWRYSVAKFAGITRRPHSPAFLNFTSRISLRSAAKVVHYGCHLSIPEDDRTFCNMRTIPSIASILKHSRKQPQSRGIN